MSAIGAIAASMGGGASGGASSLLLVEGDVVRVARGELKDLLGVVISVDLRNKQVALSLAETAGLERSYEFDMVRQC